MTRDIYQVMKEMGHAKVSMTEKYADFEISELRHDFPTLLNEPKRSEFGKWDTKSGTHLTSVCRKCCNIRT